MTKVTFDNFSCATFRELAPDKSLSEYEKIGFPDTYREGYGKTIFADICAKLADLTIPNKRCSISARSAARCRA